jgi:hypothetical protein
VSGAAVVVAGYLERCGAGCAVRDGIVERVTFRANRWRNLDTGIALLGSGAVEAAGTVERNALRTVTLDGEDLSARVVALSIQGGLAGSIDLCSPVFAGCVEFPGFHQPAVVRDSEITDAVVTGGRFGAPDAVTVAGGLSNVTTDTVAGTAVRRLSFRGSVIDGSRTSVLLAGGIVVTSGSVTGCGVDVADLAQLVTPAGGAAPVLQVADIGVGAPPGSVGGNFLNGVLVH